MQAFSLEEVKSITSKLGVQLDACDNGEGMECASLDDSLTHYAITCLTFYSAVREWAQAVFSGRISSDPHTVAVWREEGDRLLRRCEDMLVRGEQANIPCFDLPGQDMLRAAMWKLNDVLSNWVNPEIASGPIPRVKLSPDMVQDAKDRIANLPPLPEGWLPQDRRQRSLYRKAKSS
jgi:hypothetical protein